MCTLLYKQSVTEAASEIRIVCGNSQTAGERTLDQVKSDLGSLLTIAKAACPSVTVASLLPSRNQDDQQRTAERNEFLSTTCASKGARFVDNDRNFLFRDGTRDSAAFQADGLHLSAIGVRRLMSNLSLSLKVSASSKPSTAHGKGRSDRGANAGPPPPARRNRDAATGPYRYTPGQCNNCAETNHVTKTCKHRGKVLCRSCGERGHKAKHHN